jgi:hypothetical protein
MPDNPRRTLQGYLKARSHWVFALPAEEGLPGATEQKVA